jgi:hypothetical protein
MDKRTADVAIVGGGIAGGALAVRLARAGLAVTVLEQAAEYRDRVRGETMFPWCCAELVESGLLDIAVRAEGTVATRVAPYGDSMSPHDAEASALDATAVVPGVAGMLNFSHPDACRADAGSRRERGGGRSRCTRSAGHRGPATGRPIPTSPARRGRARASGRWRRRPRFHRAATAEDPAGHHGAADLRSGSARGRAHLARCNQHHRNL